MLFKNELTAAFILLLCPCFLVLGDQSSRAAGINQIQTAGDNLLYFDIGPYSPTGDLDYYN